VETLEIELPFPPSLNEYYRYVRSMKLISREGRTFRLAVENIVRSLGLKPLLGQLAVHIELVPPDNRRRDVDNYLKAPFDALKRRKDSPTGSWLFDDDSQIKHVSATMLPPAPPNGMMYMRFHERND
jgi:Holliday junction resolvase RusA-like endonuclease